ncbi:phosphoribosylformylglycinamidine synthase subunit PurS [Sulfoacidibacillus ferrooxidans]|uniref:Phosphoribosylformylglycinamidine synthase subunit PurS n=1 Tax=Sulfoacidibacillus ferrooxidans TaxID=2005001 RepID=A0A9X1V717_9BACL|nr:Phosphoribosylformylglycinamidine synthase subunit PurS [Sulfoacidibacillus ferrooxidans]
MNFLAKIYVTLKASVLDPQGTTVTHALHAQNFLSVSDVRVGKYMEVTLSAQSKEEAATLVRDMCDQLLTNPVIETYTFELTEAQS